jgi:hypothetical protein
MPVLTNSRRELFANLLAQGFAAVAAYEKAGYKRHDGNACTLAKHPEVEARLEEIRGNMVAEKTGIPFGTNAIAARANVSAESLIDEAEAARVQAMANGRESAAVAAIKEKAILSGKRVERSEIGGPGEFDHLSDEELDRTIVERFHRLFASRFAISNGTAALNGGSDDE